jgi:hypothetical protein
MFRAFSRPSSGAQWMQWQPLVLPSYRGDSRAVFVVGPAGRPAGPTTNTARLWTNVRIINWKIVASGWWFIRIKYKTPVPKVKLCSRCRRVFNRASRRLKPWWDSSCICQTNATPERVWIFRWKIPHVSARKATMSIRSFSPQPSHINCERTEIYFYRKTDHCKLGDIFGHYTAKQSSALRR